MSRLRAAFLDATRLILSWRLIPPLMMTFLDMLRVSVMGEGLSYSIVAAAASCITMQGS